MTAPQVVIEGTPWWATLLGYGIAGLLGVFGVVVGQHITARRDETRWQRERVREGERWKREDERQWLVDRREAYAGLHAAVEAWHDVLLDSWSAWKVRGRVDDDFRERLASVRREFGAPRGLVDLLAPEHVRAQVRKVYVRMRYFGLLLQADDTTRDDADANWTRLLQTEQELLRRLREDLGIVDDEEQQSGEKTPAPPR
jgi:hypothetical protein